MRRSNDLSPIYVISKGRFDRCLTARFLTRDDVAFSLVVEPQEREAYSRIFGEKNLLVTPFSNLGQGSIPARNFVWEHAKASGAASHWILDDNISMIRRFYQRQRIPCNARIALEWVEHFVDRYENIGIAGLHYTMFAPGFRKPFYLNHRVYSCLLIRNDLPYRWRGRYNEDTDLCLQVLSSRYWCTLLFCAFSIDKVATMTMRGGNTSELYHGDGRLKMARELARTWPSVVRVTRRFKRPQHVIDWKYFTIPLIPRASVTQDFPTKMVLRRQEKQEDRARLPEGVESGVS